jgi:hypothetical protein
MEMYLSYFGCLMVGLALDWALCGKAVLYGSSIWHVEPSASYRSNLFPRIIVTAAGALAICYDAYHLDPYRGGLWIGVVLFISSIIYGVVAGYRKGSRDR